MVPSEVSSINPYVFPHSKLGHESTLISTWSGYLWRQLWKLCKIMLIYCSSFQSKTRYVFSQFSILLSQICSLINEARHLQNRNSHPVSCFELLLFLERVILLVWMLGLSLKTPDKHKTFLSVGPLSGSAFVHQQPWKKNLTIPS